MDPARQQSLAGTGSSTGPAVEGHRQTAQFSPSLAQLLACQVLNGLSWYTNSLELMIGVLFLFTLRLLQWHLQPKLEAFTFVHVTQPSAQQKKSAPHAEERTVGPRRRSRPGFPVKQDGPEFPEHERPAHRKSNAPPIREVAAGQKRLPWWSKR